MPLTLTLSFRTIIVKPVEIFSRTFQSDDLSHRVQDGGIGLDTMGLNARRILQQQFVQCAHASNKKGSVEQASKEQASAEPVGRERGISRARGIRADTSGCPNDLSVHLD